MEKNAFSAGENAFSARVERVQRWKRTRSALETNVFSAGDERVQHWKRTRLTLETNAFSTGDERVWRCKRTHLKRVSFKACLH